VLRYLSDEWIAEMDEAGRRCAIDGASPVPATVEHRISGGPDGTVVYHLTIDRTGIRVRAGASEDTDATFETDWATATGLAQGERHAQVELTAGRLRAHGDTAVLAEWTAALTALEAETATVRSRTTYPAAGHA
jgi:hypothetical protein